jgi:hypothetical protein
MPRVTFFLFHARVSEMASASFTGIPALISENTGFSSGIPPDPAGRTIAGRKPDFPAGFA